MIQVGLTLRSTRTPPALPSALSQHFAILSPLSTTVQAVPVSFLSLGLAIMRITFLLVSCMLLTVGTLVAGVADYAPGGEKFAKVWAEFYVGNHEPDISSPLIRAGTEMVPVICEAIEHQDMNLRRYAITALGAIQDKRAIPSLSKILQNPREMDFYRGDSLEAIYRIDRKLGLKLARQYKSEINYLKHSVKSIHNQESKHLAQSSKVGQE